MKTIKIIDLLNKIANGEKVPKIITTSEIEECEDMIFLYDKDIQDYKTKDEDYFFELTFNKNYPVLNLEVEIIEEEKEIEKLDENNTNVLTNIIENRKKINELIDAVNELKRGN